MASPIPNPVAAGSTGLPDSTWISDTRNRLRDKPRAANSTWTADGIGGLFGAGSAPLSLNQGPVYDGTPLATYVAVRDTTSATNYTVLTTGTPSGAQVLLVYDTATLVFPAAPTAGHIMAFGWYVVKWTDAAILTGLMAGLRMLFPSVGAIYTDSSTQVAVNPWDYTLPVWAQSPDAVITKIEYRTPDNTTQPWLPLHTWERVGSTQVHINEAQKIGPAGKLRVTGWGPFQTLADLPPDLYNLPIWYAGSVLLPWQESFRIRQDTMVPLTSEGGQAPGLLTQTGDYYQKRFDAELKQKKRAYGPPGSSRPIQTTYAMWRH